MRIPDSRSKFNCRAPLRYDDVLMVAPENIIDLVKAVYPELRRVAGNLLNRERHNHTLQRTALVNEFLIRLFGNEEFNVRQSDPELRSSLREWGMLIRWIKWRCGSEGKSS